jgi:hypothetical protein
VALHSRREVLDVLFAALSVGSLGCRRGDSIARERVCVHVLDPLGSVPDPLLERRRHATVKSAANRLFELGLPELLLCTTKVRFLEMFPYFWPLTRDEVDRFRRTVTVRFERATLTGPDDVEALVKTLRDHGEGWRVPGMTSAVILTLNDASIGWADAVVAASRDARIEELVVFKDPSVPPYLCDYPALQKGFRRPP